MAGAESTAMADLVRINRWFGGWITLRNALKPLLGSSALGPEVTVVDVGCGVGDLAFRVQRLVEVEHPGVRVVGVDRFISVLHLARQGVGMTTNLCFIQADGRRLPFEDRQADIAYCATTLHHLDPAAAVTLLREMGRVARHAVVVTDLRRGWLPWWGARFLLPLLGVSPTTRHEGPLSVARAYTAPEIRELAIEADLRAVRVRRHLGHRIALVARPPC